jgi:hypothetical protein
LVVTSDVSALQRSDLNEFLFADVGTEASGMMLSVVSLFARQGDDPWREAGRLADLPKAVAADSLAHAIAEMPQGRWNLPDSAVIAARLIGLLPARPVRTERRLPTRPAEWIPSTRTAVIVACAALGIVYAISTIMRPQPARFDGGDVSSFTTPSPGDASRIGPAQVGASPVGASASGAPTP